VPITQTRSRSRKDLPDAKRKIADQDQHATYVDDSVYLPIQRLKRKYGSLNVEDEEDLRPGQETADISKDAVLVGTYRRDPKPVRLVSATIDPQTRGLTYTIQPIDKHFAFIPDHGARQPVTGETWQSDTQTVLEDQRITFIQDLRDMTYEELKQHVFEELRANGEFRNYWKSYDDMLRHPNLLDMTEEFQRFTMDAGNDDSPKYHSANEALVNLDKIAATLKDLGSTAELDYIGITEKYETEGKSSAELQTMYDRTGLGNELENTTSEVWRLIQLAFDQILSIRADPIGHQMKPLGKLDDDNRRTSAE